MFELQIEGENTGRDGALSSLKQVRAMSRGFHSQFVDNSRTFSGMTSSVLAMRWDNLFDDLEGQLESEIGLAERTADDDEERQRQAHLTLQERLRNLTVAFPRTAAGMTAEPSAACEMPVESLQITLMSGRALEVSLIRHGRDWCAVDVISPPALDGHAILPIASIAALHLHAGQLSASMGLSDTGAVSSPTTTDNMVHPTHVLPGGWQATAPRIADTIGLGFVLRDLARRRRTLEIHSLQGVFVGTLDRVGVDHCDLAEHARGEARRETQVRGYRVVTLASITLIRIL